VIIKPLNVNDWRWPITASLTQPSCKFQSSADHNSAAGLSIPVAFSCMYICCFYLIFHFLVQKSNEQCICNVCIGFLHAEIIKVTIRNGSHDHITVI
jgi:hypothetical protein